jgi:hypothetical protein
VRGCAKRSMPLRYRPRRAAIDRFAGGCAGP